MHIQEIIDVVDTLVEKGFAYQVDCDVLFEVSRFERYGRLSNQSLDEIRSGSRFESDPRKRDKADFFLWKADPDNGWDSPWGKGRPGWHIECTVMSTNILGEEFEIHGGGSDLIFPHHENEIAQSEALTGSRFVMTWLHVGHLTIHGEKMSKSLGNFITIKDMLKKYTPETIRMLLLQTKYRQPLDFTDFRLKQAEKLTKKIVDAYFKVVRQKERDCGGDRDISDEAEALRNEFIEGLDDNFNTPRALATLARVIKLARYDDLSSGSVGRIIELLEEIDLILGVLPEVESLKLPEELLLPLTQ